MRWTAQADGWWPERSSAINSRPGVRNCPRNQASCTLTHGTSPFQIQIDLRNSILVPRHRCSKVGSPFVFAQAEVQRATPSGLRLAQTLGSVNMHPSSIALVLAAASPMALAAAAQGQISAPMPRRFLTAHDFDAVWRKASSCLMSVSSSPGISWGLYSSMIWKSVRLTPKSC